MKKMTIARYGRRKNDWTAERYFFWAVYPVRDPVSSVPDPDFSGYDRKNLERKMIEVICAGVFLTVASLLLVWLWRAWK